MFVFRKRTQSLFELFEDGFRLLAKSYKQIWPWAILLSLVLGLIPEVILDLMTSNTHPETQNIYSFVTFLLIPAWVFCASVIIHRMYVIGSGADDPIMTSIRTVGRKFIKLLVAFLIVWILTHIGYLLMFFPGVFLGVVLVFVSPLILLDDFSLIHAFKGSWLLVFDNWWRIFAVICIPFIIIGYSTFTWSGINITSTLIKTFIIFLTIPFYHALMLNAFYDAKLRHHIPLHLRVRGVKHDESTSQKAEDSTSVKKPKVDPKKHK